ncbi:MAG: helix-turn-helix transcriptional regulator [Clostridia bacterium]|nr:helix-turn-helix transcriptional regulator [Clostridia bacterium]
MKLENPITVTDIRPPILVRSQKGRIFTMTRRQSFGISLCISGQITYRMNGSRYVSTPDCAVLLPQGGSYTLHDDENGLFPVINFLCEKPICSEILVLPLENPQGCLQDFKKLQNLFLFGEHRLQIFSVFYGMLQKIFPDNSPKNSRLLPVLQCIEANLSSPSLSNTTLSEKAGISEVYLRRIFREEYGTTPKQYILGIRIQKAKQMLSNTGLSVTAVSEACGFSSLFHFSRAFKEKTGLTPTEYLKENQLFHL